MNRTDLTESSERLEVDALVGDSADDASLLPWPVVEALEVLGCCDCAAGPCPPC